MANIYLQVWVMCSAKSTMAIVNGILKKTGFLAAVDMKLCNYAEYQTLISNLLQFPLNEPHSTKWTTFTLRCSLKTYLPKNYKQKSSEVLWWYIRCLNWHLATELPGEKKTNSTWATFIYIKYILSSQY